MEFEILGSLAGHLNLGFAKTAGLWLVSSAKITEGEVTLDCEEREMMPTHRGEVEARGHEPQE